MVKGRHGSRQKRLAGDTARAATSTEVKDLRREAKDLKEVVAERTLELRLLKKCRLGETNSFNPDTGTAGLPLRSYDVLNAFVEYKPKARERLTLRAAVNRIFDETYASRATYGREFSSVTPLNEPGPSLQISLQYTCYR